MKMVHLALGFFILMAMISLIAAPVGAGPINPQESPQDTGAPHFSSMILNQQELDILEMKGYDVTDIRTLIWNRDYTGAMEEMHILLETT